MYDSINDVSRDHSTDTNIEELERMIQVENLSHHELMRRMSDEYMDRKRSVGTAIILWWFFGVFGAHRFYVKDKGIALGQLFTVGGLLVWSLADVFFIKNRVREYNLTLRAELAERYGL